MAALRKLIGSTATLSELADDKVDLKTLAARVPRR
jgi:hypothetical protein